VKIESPNSVNVTAWVVLEAGAVVEVGVSVIVTFGGNSPPPLVVVSAC
jgi:hypothetical protein